MHGDEPDNAHGPTRAPTPPAEVVEEYEAFRKADPTRPIFVNLGRGAAWDDWAGRGVRKNHPEDFPDTSRDATSPRSISIPSRTCPRNSEASWISSATASSG